MPEELCQVSPKSHYVSLALHSDPSPLTLSHKGVAGGMNVVEGLFSCPPVHYVLDWSRLVSTLVQEDKEE